MVSVAKRVSLALAAWLIFLCPTHAQSALATLGAGSSPSGGVPIALVAHAGCTISNNNGCTTSGINGTTGNFGVIAVAFNTFGGSGSNPTVSDSSSNTWFGPFKWCDNGACGSGNNNVVMYYSPNATFSSSTTMTCNTSGEYPSCYFGIFSAVDTTSPFGQTSTANSSSTVTSLQTGSLTPLENGSLFLTALAEGSTAASGTPSINGSFTVTNSYGGGTTDSNTGGGLAYFVQSTAAAQSPTWSWTTARAAAAIMASFMPSSVGNAYTFSVDVENTTTGTTLTAAILAGGMTTGNPNYNLAANWSIGAGTAADITADSGCQDAQVTAKNIAGNSYTDSGGSLGIKMNDSATTATNWLLTLPVPQGTAPSSISEGFNYYPNITTADSGYYSHNGVFNTAGDFLSLMVHSGSMYMETQKCPNCNPDSGSFYSYTDDTWYHITNQFIGYTVLDTSSTSSVAIPGSTGGTITLTTAASDNLTAGTVVSAFSQASSANGVSGTVSSDSGTTLVITVNNLYGSGTPTAWNISTSAHTLKIYSNTGTLLSTQQKISSPTDTGGPTKIGVGRGGDSGTTAGTYTCTDGLVVQFEGAPIFPVLP
jgi:hypothetical protein